MRFSAKMIVNATFCNKGKNAYSSVIVLKFAHANVALIDQDQAKVYCI